MIYISAVGMINALGDNCDEIAANLTRGIAPGMRPRPGWLEGQPAAVLGGVDGVLPAIADDFAAHRSRNNQLLLAALARSVPRSTRPSRASEATASRWCSAPAPPASTRAIFTWLPR
jgi:3-oxoacyl-[acyl-carrier-protein] synthase-1